MTYYEKVISMLPHKLKEPENAINLKKMLKVFSKFLEEDQQKSYKYNMLLSINDLSGSELDVLADMYYVYRLPNESDEDFRIRIVQQLLIKKSRNSIPSIQNIINRLLSSGRVFIHENHSGGPANVYLGGNATNKEMNLIYDTIAGIIPAGVRIIFPIFRLDTWQVVKDSADTWGEIKDSKFIW